MLADLKPFFDRDPDISCGDLVPSVIKTLEHHGKPYDFIPGFGIETLVGSSQVVGEPDGWTPEEFIKAVQTNSGISAFGPELTRTQFLRYVLMFTGDEYVDPENASCTFENNDFITLLKLATSLPAEVETDSSSQDYGRVYNGKQLFC